MQLHPYVGLPGWFPVTETWSKDHPAITGTIVFVGVDADEYGAWTVATLLRPDKTHYKGLLEKLEVDPVALAARLASWAPTARELRIVVSGTGPDVAFVEVEDANGRSVAPDTMRERPDGTRELVFFDVPGGAS